jgi:cytoskeletal protein RodZ
MAKRDPDPEPLDEELVETEPSPVGEQLRLAREAKKLSLEDVAAQTRIPLRHLASIETGDWDHLPAPTYTIGFAKSYASAVGLDRSEVGNQLREEMGGQRFATSTSDVFEPADPRRTMPKGLVIGAIVAVILLIAIMSWLNKRSLEEPETNNATAAEAGPPPPATPQAAAPPAAPTATQGPVLLAATAPVWLQVSDRGASLFSGTLQPGQTYTVPANAAAPVLKTGKPEALKVTVGNAVAPPVGPPATTVSDVSLLPADLLKSGQAAASAPTPAAPTTAPGPAPKPRERARRPAASGPTQPSAPAETAPTTNTGE